MISDLRLYSTLLPILSARSVRADELVQDKGGDVLEYLEVASADIDTKLLRSAEKFDCRALPLALLKQSGEERVAELADGAEASRLPFGGCWFEFDDFGVYATESDETVMLPDVFNSPEVRHVGVRRFSLDKNDWERDARESDSVSVDIWAKKEYATNYGPEEEFEPILIEEIGIDNFATRINADLHKDAATLILGVLVLLEERLLRSANQEKQRQSERLKRA